jgi:hypothetical protein
MKKRNNIRITFFSLDKAMDSFNGIFRSCALVINTVNEPEIK